jgi:hypothetical protein
MDHKQETKQHSCTHTLTVSRPLVLSHCPWLLKVAPPGVRSVIGKAKSSGVDIPWSPAEMFQTSATQSEFCQSSLKSC